MPSEHAALLKDSVTDFARGTTIARVRKLRGSAREYDRALWQCDALFLREDVHRRHFANLAADFDRAKYEMFTG